MDMNLRSGLAHTIIDLVKVPILDKYSGLFILNMVFDIVVAEMLDKHLLLR